jgi:hypothetical protein
MEIFGVGDSVVLEVKENKTSERKNARSLLL